MAPSSQERSRPYPIKKSRECLLDDGLQKYGLPSEKQRPPIYNPEDYTLSLKKWGRKQMGANCTLYSGAVEDPGGTEPPKNDTLDRTDYRNPLLTEANGEMRLKQFHTVSDLLTKLLADLRCSFPSFVQEFVSDPTEGCTLLLELLRNVQLSQMGGTVQRIAPSVQRKALLDELTCLQCMYYCCTRYTDAVRKLSQAAPGLYALTACIMSNVNKTRILALQMLVMICESEQMIGHNAVSESLSTLRLRFGEPVRFKFLIGIIHSSGNAPDLMLTALRFLNAFIACCNSRQKRLYIQSELEQAGFDVQSVRKITPANSQYCNKILSELDRWTSNYIDIDKIMMNTKMIESENATLKEKLKLLESHVKTLQEEKGARVTLEKRLKKNNYSQMVQEKTHRDMNHSSPAEDEGISSSERSLTPDNNRPLQQLQPRSRASIYEIMNVSNENIRNENIHPTTINDKTNEDPAIEMVIDEMQNLITRPIDSIIASTPKIEAEIVPNLHPQPPKKVRNLIHLFFTPSNGEISEYELRQDDYERYESVKEKNNTNKTSESDSLLSRVIDGKCNDLDTLQNLENLQTPVVPRIDRDEIIKNSHDNRLLLNSIMDARERAEQLEMKRRKRLKMLNASTMSQSQDVDNCYEVVQNGVHMTDFDGEKQDFKKSKSLDRIDDGLDAMIDIVLTKESNKRRSIYSKASEMSNQSHKSIVFISSGSIKRSKSCHRVGNVEKLEKNDQTHTPDFEYSHKIVLPNQSSENMTKVSNIDHRHTMFLPDSSQNLTPCTYTNQVWSGNGKWFGSELKWSLNKMDGDQSGSGKVSNDSFSVRNTTKNAGLYSGGQNIIGGGSDFNNLSAFVNKPNVSKLSDLVSGLY